MGSKFSVKQWKTLRDTANPLALEFAQFSKGLGPDTGTYGKLGRKAIVRGRCELMTAMRTTQTFGMKLFNVN